MRKKRQHKYTPPICGITMGDPAGVGPEIIIRALSDPRIRALARFLLIGDQKVFTKIIRQLKARPPSRQIEFFHATDAGNFSQGQPSRKNGKAALDCVDAGIKLAKEGEIDCLVTAPVDKHTVSASSPDFIGHTEYLAAAWGAKKYLMMLVGGPLRVALVTRHLALKDVARELTQEKIYDTISICSQALKQYFAIAQPRIAVCGLNPHCGEKGIMGKEEERLIRPAIKKAGHLARVMGPFAADTLFYSAAQGAYDAVVAMYHDQGLIPLKMLALHEGVNITLGLPFIRTSPDHGTAYDIASKLKANPGSMKAAIKLAVFMALCKRQKRS